MGTSSVKFCSSLAEGASSSKGKLPYNISQAQMRFWAQTSTVLPSIDLT